jgi:hypothetical protein
MLSLKDRIDLLGRDLTATPMRIATHADLPFAILRYEPENEWEMRREAAQLATRLGNAGKRVTTLSLADLLWEAIAASEGIKAIVALETSYGDVGRGYEAAQDQITTYLSNKLWSPLPDLLVERLRPLDPERDIAFLMRASAMAPAIYHMSRLLEEMQGRTHVPAILFYPGTLEGTTGLRFMGLKDREALGNYRVKIYG